MSAATAGEREGTVRDELCDSAGLSWARPGNEYEAGVEQSEERAAPEKRAGVRARP